VAPAGDALSLNPTSSDPLTEVNTTATPDAPVLAILVRPSFDRVTASIASSLALLPLIDHSSGGLIGEVGKDGTV
jgi:hypothetical protein